MGSPHGAFGGPAIRQSRARFGKLSGVESFQVVDVLGFRADRAHPGLVWARHAFIRGPWDVNFYSFLLGASVCLLAVSGLAKL